MHGLLSDVGTIIASAIKRGVYWVVAGLIGLVGLGFGLAAAQILLAEEFGAGLAAAMIAGGLFLIAGVLAFTLARRANRRERVRAQARTAAATQMAMLPLAVTAFTTAMTAGQNIRRR